MENPDVHSVSGSVSIKLCTVPSLPYPGQVGDVEDLGLSQVTFDVNDPGFEGLYGDNGKENRNHYSKMSSYRGYIGFWVLGLGVEFQGFSHNNKKGTSPAKKNVRFGEILTSTEDEQQRERAVRRPPYVVAFFREFSTDLPSQYCGMPLRVNLTSDGARRYKIQPLS